MTYFSKKKIIFYFWRCPFLYLKVDFNLAIFYLSLFFLILLLYAVSVRSSWLASGFDDTTQSSVILLWSIHSISSALPMYILLPSASGFLQFHHLMDQSILFFRLSVYVAEEVFELPLSWIVCSSPTSLEMRFSTNEFL